MEGDELGRILAGLRESDSDDAWTAFLERYASVIYAVVSPHGRDNEERSECFLFVCEKLIENQFRRLRKFRLDGNASFTTWLRVVVRRLSIDWHRRRVGRYRPFESIRRLTVLEHEIYQCVYEQGLDVEGTFLLLRSRFPTLSRQNIQDGLDRVEGSLDSRQRFLAGLRRVSAPYLEADAESVADVRADPEALLTEAEQRALLTEALERLSVGDRLLIRLRFEQELTLKEIARLTGAVGPQSVHRRIRSILLGLRDAFPR